MIKHIMLDVDDTLNSLTMHVLKFLGCPVGDYDYHRFPCLGEYDIEKAYHILKPKTCPDLTTAQFWRSLPRRIWSKTPMSIEASYLIRRAAILVGEENVCLLTASTKDPECLAGKLEWIHSHCPAWLHRQYLIGPRKHFCANPETLLIDDSDANVNKFRQHGGHAILVPRPWNSLHGVATQRYLVSELRTHFPQVLA